MKKYVGKRVGGRAQVSKFEEDVEQPLPTRTDIRNHSPDGFNWGYGGSGPAQLALSIMADIIGPDKAPETCPLCQSKMDGDECSERVECGYDWLNDDGRWRRVNGLYQQFKVDMIATLPDEWTITEADIKRWLWSVGMRDGASV